MKDKSLTVLEIIIVISVVGLLALFLTISNAKETTFDTVNKSHSQAVGLQNKEETINRLKYREQISELLSITVKTIAEYNYENGWKDGYASCLKSKFIREGAGSPEESKR